MHGKHPNLAKYCRVFTVTVGYLRSLSGIGSHQATKCIHGKPIKEEKQRASHAPDSTVCPVGDRVHDEGDDTSVQTESC